MSRNESRGERGFIGSKKFLVGKKQEGEGFRRTRKNREKKEELLQLLVQLMLGSGWVAGSLFAAGSRRELCWRLIKDTKFLIKPLSERRDERRECPALMTWSISTSLSVPHTVSRSIIIVCPSWNQIPVFEFHEATTAWVLSLSSRSSEYAEKRRWKKESRNCRFLYIHLRFCFIFGVKTSKVWKERREELPENQERYFADTWMKRTKGKR